MDIIFASAKLEKQLNQQKAMTKTYGPQRARRLMIVMTALRAAPNLATFAPPYSPPHRCHELTGNRKRTLSLDLDGPCRLLIQPIDEPLPRRPEGGLDWTKVTAVKVIGVEDTHG